MDHRDDAADSARGFASLLTLVHGLAARLAASGADGRSGSVDRHGADAPICASDLVTALPLAFRALLAGTVSPE